MSYMHTAASRLRQIQQILHRIPNLTSCHTFSTLQNDVIQMQVTPRVSLFDQKVHIRVQGLPANTKVTLHLSREQEWRRAPVLFVSCSHHVSSQAGEVDLSNNPSLGGTYTGLDPMGLFWSLHSSPGGPQNTRLVVKNVEEPLLYNLSVYKGHLTLSDLHTGGVRHQPLSTTTVTRMVKMADVRKLPVREGNIRGMLFLPPGDGTHPGVIDMFGSSGGIIETRAALLASHGFATLSLPYFRYDDRPTKLEDIDFHYFEEAAQWMNSYKSVKKGGIDVVGVSKGAEFAIMMGWKCPEVVAVVQINGPPFYSAHNLMRAGKPFLRGVPVDLGRANPTEDGLNISKCFPHKPDDIIPIWEGSAHVLTLISDDDGQLETGLGEELLSQCPASKRHLLEVVHYPGAGHLLEPPYTPFCRACINPTFNINMLWGGNTVAHAKAQVDSWQRILTFLSTHLS